jgi:MraZ protein
MFLGEYRHTLDDKGRLTVPARYRQLLAEGGYITQGFDQNLMVLRERNFQAVIDRITKQAVTDPSVRELARVLFSQADFVQPDKSGRILVPQPMREKHHLDGELVIVGVGTYFEIWTPERWAAQTEHLDEAAGNASYFEKLQIDFSFGEE